MPKQKGSLSGLKKVLTDGPKVRTAKEIEEIEAKQRWAKKPVAVIVNTSNRVKFWDINGRGTCAVRFLPGCALTATAMQMEGMTHPPPGIVVHRYNPDSREHIRLKGIG